MKCRTLRGLSKVVVYSMTLLLIPWGPGCPPSRNGRVPFDQPLCAEDADCANATGGALRNERGVGEGDMLTGPHVGKLGGQLCRRHLIAVEVAGTLILAALVGAVAIVAQGVEPRKGTQQGRASDA